MFTTFIPECLIPSNDEQRLASLQSYGILDTPAEETFDKIARLARQIFNVPYSFITFVDSQRVFYKANFSPLEENTLAREDSLCSIAVLNDEVTVFTDTLEHEQLANNPHVSMENGLRFYAGAPLRTADGYQLGVLCVLDMEPRLVTARQVDMLKTLATIVVDELEYRKLNNDKINFNTSLQARLQPSLQAIQTAGREIEAGLPIGSGLKEQATIIKQASVEIARLLENV